MNFEEGGQREAEGSRSIGIEKSSSHDWEDCAVSDTVEHQETEDGYRVDVCS